MFGARLWARMPPEHLVALRAFAFQSGVPLAEYVRGWCMTISSKEVPASGKEVPLIAL